jgi:PAS domain S-box-containing protein
MEPPGHGVYSIGAVAKMLEVPAQTLRSWEDRYGQVVPDRSAGGQRLYSRHQVQQLRFILQELARGRQPADAHRLLEEQGRSPVEPLPANDAALTDLPAEPGTHSADLGRPVDEGALWRLAAALGGAMTPERVAQALAEEGGLAAGGAFANMAFRLPDAARVQIVHRSVLDPDPAGSRVFDLDAAIPACESIRSGQPVLLGSVEMIRRRFPAIFGEIEAAGLSARATLPLHSGHGEVLGAVGFGWQEPQKFDSTQLRRLDLIAQLAGLALDRALREGPSVTDGRNLTEALETMPNAFFSLDNDFRITHVNTEGARLLRSTRESLTGNSWLNVFPQAAGSEFERQYRRALELGQPTVFEEYYPPLETWFEVHAWPSDHGLNVYFTDISERRFVETNRTAELANAELANRRLRLLTDLTARLSGSEDRTEVYERLTEVMVPGMADWCTVVVPGEEALIRVAARHRDPALDALAKRLVGAYPHAYSGPSPGVVAYRSGQPLRMGHLAKEIVEELDDSVASAAYGRTLQLLGDGPGLLTPVAMDGEVQAVLTLTRSGGDPFTDADVVAMLEVASSVASALSAADHHHTQRETARALQAAALPTSLPTSDRLQIAASYREASGAAQVGGDWYDAIELEGGRIALVVGDVAGHGLPAASLTAQMRNALRAHLFAGAGPLESLLQLSRLVATQEPDALATIICLEIEPESGVCLWASAGHPSPIVVNPDGTSAHLQGRPAPPIGCSGPFFAETGAEYRTILHPGGRLLLFTDGLFERRNVTLDVGLAHLMITAEQTLHESDPSQACAEILRAMLGDTHEDDACLLIADRRVSAP